MNIFMCRRLLLGLYQVKIETNAEADRKVCSPRRPLPSLTTSLLPLARPCVRPARACNCSPRPSFVRRPMSAQEHERQP